MSRTVLRCAAVARHLTTRRHLTTTTPAYGELFKNMSHLVQPESIADAVKYERALEQELSKLASEMGRTARDLYDDSKALAQAAEAVLDRASREGEGTVGLRRGGYSLPNTRDVSGSKIHSESDVKGKTGVEAPKPS